MAKTKILVIEDERSLTEVLAYNLEKEGYEVFLSHDGKEGLRKAQTSLPDLILLDVMLPNLTGTNLCTILKSEPVTANIPVIMMTAKSEESDQLQGFASGADDYVTKPFSPKILLQRVKALLRRSKATEEIDDTDVLQAGKLKLNKRSHQVTVGTQNIALTLTEFRILETLMRQPGKAFTRHDLIDCAMGDGTVVLERTIDVHIKSLRKKLGAQGDFIATIRGVGYRFGEATE